MNIYEKEEKLKLLQKKLLEKEEYLKTKFKDLKKERKNIKRENDFKFRKFYNILKIYFEKEEKQKKIEKMKLNNIVAYLKDLEKKEQNEKKDTISISKHINDIMNEIKKI